MKFSKYISQQILFSSADNGDGEIRTLDPLLARQVLSQLSYAPILMGLSGLEPPTSRLSGVRSNRLSYKPILVLARYFLSRIFKNSCCLMIQVLFLLVEISGIEPLTPCLQSRCSSQLS